MTVNVKGTLAPAAGAAGIVNWDALAPAKLESVPVKTVVAPEVIARFSLAHRSVAEPFTGPLFDWVQVVPGVRVNVFAAADPVFLIVIDVLTACPGTIAVFPPNLLMLAQVAALVDTDDPLVLEHVTLPAAFDSCIVNVPVAAEFVVFVMLAAKPESVPVNDSDRRRAAATPAKTATGAK